MFCPHCGAQLPIKARFCTSCGASMNTSTGHEQFEQDNPASVVVNHKRTSSNRITLVSILLLALVILIVVILLTLILGKKTVYLCTETVNEGNPMSPSITTRYEYDDKGRVINYQYDLAYPESVSIDDISYEISHTYDRKGNLTAAEFDINGERFGAEYVYQRNILIGIELDDLPEGYDEDEVEIKCDDMGNVIYVSVESDDDTGSVTWEFDYYDNGVIQCVSCNNSITDREFTTEYDEQGIQRVMEDCIPGQYRTINNYDEYGNTTLIKQYDGNDELTQMMEYEYLYDEDQLMGMYWTLGLPDENGDLMNVTLEFDCDWDALECEMTVDDIVFPKGFDADQMDEAKKNLRDAELEICFEMDEAGNLIAYEMVAMDMVLMSGYKEYLKFKVPRDYKPDFNRNPTYLYFLSEL